MLSHLVDVVGQVVIYVRDLLSVELLRIGVMLRKVLSLELLNSGKLRVNQNFYDRLVLV